MARITIKTSRWVLATLICFFITVALGKEVQAAPAAVFLEETKWRTGELEIKYTGAHIGYMMVLYAATYDTDGEYEAVDTWYAIAESGTHVTKPFLNGQSIWYYVRQYDPMSNEGGPQSNLLKQTPPITAYIINWPDMLNDLNSVINNALTPSDKSLNDLKDAVDNLKNAVGAGQAAGAGNALKDGIDGAQGGMSPPIVHDDGNGTYSGGSTGGQLPNPWKPSGGGGITLNAPDPDSGTDTEMTIRIPYGVDMQGQLLYVKIFTAEQMEKLKWWGKVRELLGSALWVIFTVWLTERFTPIFKV